MPWTGTSVSWPGFGTAGLAQQQVDEQVAGLGLAVIVGVGCSWFAALAAAISACSALISASSAARSSSLARRFRSSSSRALTVSTKRAAASCSCASVVVGTDALRGSASAENASAGRLRAACVGAGEPIGDVEQLAQARDCAVEADAARLVGRLVAKILDDARLGDQRGTKHLLKCRLVDAGRERGFERILQRPFVAIEPVDDCLQ